MDSTSTPRTSPETLKFLAAVGFRMETEIPDIVEQTLDEESIVDVSSEYTETISMFVDLSEARSDPIPLQHVLAYTNTETEPGHVVFLFVIDTDEEYLDETFCFEIGVEKSVADRFEADDDAGDARHEMVLEQFNSSLRSAKETVWQTVLNDPYER